MENKLLLFILLFLAIPTKGFAQEGLWTDEGNYDTSWYDETVTEFTLTTPAQLAGLSKLVNDGNGFYRKTVKLGADINLGAHCWWPIGTSTKQNESERSFGGTFDGNNHTLNKMIINEKQCNEYNYIGLFGKVYNGKLLNIILSPDCAIQGGTSQESYYSAAGGIASSLIKGSIENCTSNASITYRLSGGIIGTIDRNSSVIDCTNNGNIKGTNVGGIAGSSDGSIAHCQNNGSINGNRTSGGIAGFSNGALSECKNSGTVASVMGAAGGIVGSGMGKTISRCENVGNISTQATDQLYDCPAAGIIGYAEADGFQYVEYCINRGNITGETTAGIVGALRPVGWYIREIRECINYGTVSGLHWSGGVIAYNDASMVILGCMNKGNISAIDIKGVSDEIGGTSTYAGGIAAFCATCINCCNYGSITANAHHTQGRDLGASSFACCGGISGLGDSFNCFNRGEVSCNSYAHTNSKICYANAELHVGGITGADRNCETDNCYNSGKVSHSIHAYSAGGANYANKSTFTGGIAGGFNVYASDEGPKIINCYYSNEGLESAYKKGTSGYTELSAMKTQDLADLLNEKRPNIIYSGKSYTASVWKLDESDELPILDIDQTTAIENFYLSHRASENAPLFMQSIVSTVATLNLDDLGQKNIYIYTINGVLISQYATDSNTLDMNQYPDGEYIIVVKARNICKSGKLIIKH